VMDQLKMPDAPRPPPTRAYTVAQLVRQASRRLESHFADVWGEGEVSNLSRPRSGHLYFTLKDRQAQLSVVIFRSAAVRLKFSIEDGQKIRCRGKLGIYDAQGRFQLTAETAEPTGVGALQAEFEQLKTKLAAEGLFDQDHKKPLPLLPGTIAVVTSPTGAALQDVLRVLHQRCPVRVVICPTPVQGAGAAMEVVAALRRADRLGADVIIVGRGGGSLEDLWAFNEEAVARAIYASEIPVISAVGHEVDVSISDLVADARALTPTQAGEMVVPSRELLDERLARAAARLSQALLGAVSHAKTKLDVIARSYAMRVPMEAVRQHQQRLDEITQRMPSAANRELARLRERLVRGHARLQSLSPMGVLARGYSITTLAGSDRPLRSPDDAPAGSRIRTILHDGELESEVSSAGGCA